MIRVPVIAYVVATHQSAVEAFEKTIDHLTSKRVGFTSRRDTLIILTESERHMFIVGNEDVRFRYCGYQFRHIKFQEGGKFSGDVINYLLSRVRYVE